jgi:hypothetical protein
MANYLNHLNHKATGKIRLIYLKDESVEVSGEIKLDSKGKILSIFGKAELYVINREQEHMIPLEWNPIKQRFCYVVDENGKFWDDWSYWEKEDYKELLNFTGKTCSTCS